jgi:hypothetical protein
MPTPRPLATLYILILTLSAIGSTALALRDVSVPDEERLLVAGVLLGLLTLACAMPLHIGPKLKITLDMSLLFAVTLLFAPGIAMIIAGLGMLAAQMMRRASREEVAFNTAQLVLQAAAGGLILHVAGWHASGLALDTPVALVTIAGTALAIYAVNTLAVALIIWLDAGEPLGAVLRSSVSFGVFQDLGLLSLGLFVAVLVDIDATLLPLLLIPAVVLYLALIWHIRLREQPGPLIPVSRLPSSAYVYLGIVGLTTAALLPILRDGIQALDLRTILLAIAVTACATLAYLFPLELGSKRKLILDDGVVFAAILLFEPGVAVLIAGVGVFVSHRIRHQPHAQSVFNSAQLMLQAAVGALLLSLIGWQPGEAAFWEFNMVWLLALLPFVLYLINTWAVATMIGMQQQCNPLDIWRNGVGVGDVSLRLVQSGLGLGAAVLAVHAPWTIPLGVLPGVAIYQVLRTRQRRSYLWARISVAPPSAGDRSARAAHADVS